MIELTLPYAPSVNHYKTVGRLTRTKTGKLYQQRINSSETHTYYHQVWGIVKLRQLESFKAARLKMDVGIYPPDHRKRDIDGILKVLLDSLQRAGLYDDDNQIDRLLVTRHEVYAPNGKIVVKLEKMT
jgi:crossover junction endodeoxyribonuclease RusA